VEEAMEYWGADGERVDGGNIEIYELARKAVKLADEDIDFSKYDGDGDGVVDHVLIIHAGGAQEDTGVESDIWSHRWEIGEKGEPVDGVKVFGYIMVSEHSPLGIIAHEFGHDLGLPDLYNTENGQSMIGGWGLMDLGCRLGEPPGSTPSHPCCWSKVQLGWIEPEVVDAANIREIYQIESYNTNSLYKLMVKDRKGERDEYFLVTNRQMWGFDKFLPGVGLLIWHIDDSIGSIEENNVNTDPWHPRVYLEQADGKDDLRKGCKGDEFDPFYEGNTQSENPTSFGTNTKPDSRAYDGSETGIEIVGISAPGEIMYANKLIWLVSPEDGEMLRTLYFEWRAFKDAESYKIKIFRDFNSPILEDVTPLTQYTPEEDEITRGGYYWIVEGYAGNELIAKSEVWAFWYEIKPLKDVSSYPFPNPFNPFKEEVVNIKFKLSKRVKELDEISLKIFNLAGEFIRKINEIEDCGTKENPLYIGKWNGCNEAGQKVASGLYFYLISAKKDVIVGKVAIVK
jgi:M6 family metalloprotease-like protein